MGRADPSYRVVGHLNKPHGTKGELFVWPLTDHPEGSFAPGVVLYMGSGEDGEPDPDLPPLRVETARPFRRGFLVRFGGVEDRTQAQSFQGRYVMRSADDLEARDDDELFYHELLGLAVETESGQALGEITEVYELNPADMLEVRDGSRVRMIPFLLDWIVEVDLDEGLLVIDPPDGLLDL